MLVLWLSNVRAQTSENHLTFFLTYAQWLPCIQALGPHLYKENERKGSAVCFLQQEVKGFPGSLTAFLLTSHWPSLCHVATSSSKRECRSKIQVLVFSFSFHFQASVMEGSRANGSSECLLGGQWAACMPWGVPA